MIARIIEAFAVRRFFRLASEEKRQMIAEHNRINAGRRRPFRITIHRRG